MRILGSRSPACAYSSSMCVRGTAVLSSSSSTCSVGIGCHAAAAAMAGHETQSLALRMLLRAASPQQHSTGSCLLNDVGAQKLTEATPPACAAQPPLSAARWGWACPLHPGQQRCGVINGAAAARQRQATAQKRGKRRRHSNVMSSILDPDGAQHGSGTGQQAAPSSACRILRFFSYSSFSLPSRLLRYRNSFLSRALRRSMAAG